jgi:hypothetical protein
MPCALPPLDQRYSRVVAVDAQGIDLVAFGADRRPTAAAVVAALPGRVIRDGGYTRYGYRNSVIVESAFVGMRSIWICYSGLAFGGRAPAGEMIRAGGAIGTIELPSVMPIMRTTDRTAGVSPREPYLHVEAWDRFPPVYSDSRSLTGTDWRLEQGAISPRAFWPSIGIDFVGPAGSQVLAIRAGGPADPSVCT